MANYIHIGIKKDTLDMFTRCVEKHKRLHPEDSRRKISKDEMLFRVCSWYVDSPDKVFKW